MAGFPAPAQQIIDRLRAVDLARPVLDRARAESYVAEHFHRLQLSMPAVRWARDAVEGLLYVRRAAWSAARSAAGSAAWRAAESAARSAAWRRLAEIWAPFLDAFESGLWVYWVTEREFVAVPRPALHLVADRLHKTDGPAVVWEAGARFYFWRGVQVTDQIIERPDELTGEQIFKEPNTEVRRAMVERIGTTRFFELIGNPQPIHRDRTGELYRLDFPDDPEPLVAVHVTDPSTGRRYFLRVPPTITRAREAVAWTFEMDEKAWAPAVET